MPFSVGTSQRRTVGRRPGVALALVALVAMGCTKTMAFGDANSIIVGMPNELWEQVESDVDGALEQTVFTVTDEKAFTVTQIDPRDPDWANLRKFKQVLLVGTANDPWVAEALAEADGDFKPPQTLQVHDVWARSQLVTIALLSEGDPRPQLQKLLPPLAKQFDKQYREYVKARMFVSGVDTALTTELRQTAGFSIELPRVYQHVTEDSVHVFRNDNPDPSELIRQIAITWKSPIPDSLGPDDLISWRSEVAELHYEDEQVVNMDRPRGGPGVFGKQDAYQIQTTWESPPGAWPAGGPLLIRSVMCMDQDRVYLIDGWLYAPGKEKYEYMIQLETILNSFTC